MDWLIRILQKKVLLHTHACLAKCDCGCRNILKYNIWHIWHNVGLWAQKRWLSIIKPFCKSGLERGCRIVLTIKRKGRRRRHIQPNHWSWSLVCRVARKIRQIRFLWDLFFSFLSPIFCIFLSDLTIDQPVRNSWPVQLQHKHISQPCSILSTLWMRKGGYHFWTEMFGLIFVFTDCGLSPRWVGTTRLALVWPLALVSGPFLDFLWPISWFLDSENHWK